ncbi:MAG TPA: enoyl-CoA hydratase family protein [Steroidobacteraceae bacterium]|jgi:enoyl-CoA hydratase/carnithine racemase|nr:enoyl-CoA hydratase family protein [Steroidobacteraceae bacterium]
MNGSDLSAYEARNFLWRVEGRVGFLTLNRPERKNPLTFESYAELRDLFRALAAGGGVRAVVIDGAGGNFCSGGDVHEIIGPLTRMDERGLLDFTRMTGDLIRAMRACPQPVIAAIDGTCAGAGAMIALASDFRYATPAAKAAFLFVRVGLAGCDMGACALLPRVIGQGRAAELLYTGRAFDAAEGERIGFFNAVVPAEALLPTATKLACEIAAGPTLAHALTKKMLHVEWNMGIDEALDSEALAQAWLMKSNDFRRAYEAFAAKKKPVFEGD